jgi:A/G-specific adenine glycosylase
VPAAAHPATLRSVRRRILAWYEADHRDFAFRRSRDPWPVLVAEVMLQQTQASRIAERFDAFMDRFPSPTTMAASTPAAVLAAWSGLGYNRRALNLHAAAVAITNRGWPSTVAGLEQLLGIGPYSARAIASIAFGEPVGAVDTNVRRWLVRRFAAEPHDRQRLASLADGLATAGPAGLAAGTWTHATMEFGARICTARAPRCDSCPVARGCPSRLRPARVPVPRQSAATAPGRAARGAVLRALAASPGHRLTIAQAAAAADGASAREEGTDIELVLAGLERDGLLHRSRRSVALGPS